MPRRDARGGGITPAPPEAAAEEKTSTRSEGEGSKEEVAIAVVFFDKGIRIPMTLEALGCLGRTTLLASS